LGQGNFQSIPALIAEEFEVSLSQVVIKNTNGERNFPARAPAEVRVCVAAMPF